MKIKFFNIKDEQPINDFLAENRILNDGIRVHADAGMVSIAYSDGFGITKKDLVSILNSELAKQQQEKLTAEMARRNWLSREVIVQDKNKTQSKQDEAEGNRRAAEQAVADCEQAIRTIQTLIADVEAETFTV